MMRTVLNIATFILIVAIISDMLERNLTGGRGWYYGMRSFYFGSEFLGTAGMICEARYWQAVK